MRSFRDPSLGLSSHPVAVLVVFRHIATPLPTRRAEVCGHFLCERGAQGVAYMVMGRRWSNDLFGVRV